MAKSDIVMMDALALSRAIKAKQVSCVEVMNAYLDHIGALNPTVNAIVSLQDRGDLIKQAQERAAELARGDYRGWMHGFPHDEIARTRVIAMLGIEHLLKRRTGALSGGERQRIAIGRALLTQPRLLLLDEPLASLDAARKAEILPYLMRLRDEAGIPMVYVTHQAGEIRRIATRVVRLEDGRVAGAGGLEQIDAAEAALA